MSSEYNIENSDIYKFKNYSVLEVIIIVFLVLVFFTLLYATLFHSGLVRKRCKTYLNSDYNLIPKHNAEVNAESHH